jgi:hypothetical protein
VTLTTIKLALVKPFWRKIKFHPVGNCSIIG